VAESSSSVLGGIAFDVMHMSVRKVALLMAAVAAVMAALWVLYAVREWPKGSPTKLDEESSRDEEREQLL
jgi:sugar phosphate permease